eukprot:TRINITY_DN2092_c0_g1_i1.p1 TRINITY_DN2092_c0_g1~~TRINITY_DN2092_c0_g1_i1.p1  ORF type:complete len:548 (-),score=131.58 TRINITY_DN2092_c0_g1_i1:234-1817(-)
MARFAAGALLALAVSLALTPATLAFQMVPETMFAKSRASLGATVKLNKDGYAQVLASKDEDAMKAFILRVMDESDLTVNQQDMHLLDEFAGFAAQTGQFRTLPQLKRALEMQQWIVQKIKAAAAQVVESMHGAANKLQKMMGRSKEKVDAHHSAAHHSKPSAASHTNHTATPKHTATKVAPKASAHAVHKEPEHSMKKVAAKPSVHVVHKEPEKTQTQHDDTLKPPPLEEKHEQSSAGTQDKHDSAPASPQPVTGGTQEIAHEIAEMVDGITSAEEQETASVAAAVSNAETGASAQEVSEALKDLQAHKPVKVHTQAKHDSAPTSPRTVAKETGEIADEIGKMVDRLQSAEERIASVAPAVPSSEASEAAPQPQQVHKALKDLQPPKPVDVHKQPEAAKPASGEGAQGDAVASADAQESLPTEQGSAPAAHIDAKPAPEHSSASTPAVKKVATSAQHHTIQKHHAVKKVPHPKMAAAAHKVHSTNTIKSNSSSVGEKLERSGAFARVPETRVVVMLALAGFAAQYAA